MFLPFRTSRKNVLMSLAHVQISTYGSNHVAKDIRTYSTNNDFNMYLDKRLLLGNVSVVTPQAALNFTQNYTINDATKYQTLIMKVNEKS